MKIRNGFVSNSSSSSFVIIGYKMKDLNLSDENKKNIMDKLDYKSYCKDDNKQKWYDFLYSNCLEKIGENIGHLGNDGSGYIGLIIADVSSDGGCLENKTVGLDEINYKVQKLKEFFNVEISPKVYTGTRSC